MPAYGCGDVLKRIGLESKRTMFSCKKASRLISCSLDRELTFRERFAMRFHLCICRMCRKAYRQLRFLQSMSPDDAYIDDLLADQKLSMESRKRIREALEKEISESGNK